MVRQTLIGGISVSQAGLLASSQGVEGALEIRLRAQDAESCNNAGLKSVPDVKASVASSS